MGPTDGCWPRIDESRSGFFTKPRNEMQLPPPYPTSGPGFDPEATCRELAQLVCLAEEMDEVPACEGMTPGMPMHRIAKILSELGQNYRLDPFRFIIEDQHYILREGPSPENPTEALPDQQSFFDQIPEN